MRNHARLMCAAVVGFTAVAALAVTAGRVQADDPNSAPNPYHAVENWAKLPQGRAWGMAIGVAIDRDGSSVWVYDRCAAKSCEGSNIAPIQKFDATGRLVVSFGSGLVNWPHGLFIDSDDNIWVTDGHGGGGKGHTAMKFAPDGRLLMTLGKPGVAGNGEDTFNSPSACSGGAEWRHFRCRRPRRRYQCPHRQFFKDGKLITAWGSAGSGPGRFNGRTASPWTRPAICSSPIGRTIASKYSSRMENSSTNGSSSAGLAASISATTCSMWPIRNPARKSIRRSAKASASAAQRTARSRLHRPDRPGHGNARGVAADKNGNIFGGFAANMDFKKFVKNRRNVGPPDAARRILCRRWVRIPRLRRASLAVMYTRHFAPAR